MINVKTLSKLNEARCKLVELNLKKTGENTFSKYKYYKLEDFLPHVLNICKEVKLTPIISFKPEQAILSIYDTELEDSVIEFMCDDAKCTVKGAMDIQNEGAKQTYLKRYLYMNAFEIAETDTVEETAQENAQAAGGDMYRQELINKLTGFGLTVAKLVAYKGSLENIPTDYLEDQVRKFEEKAAKIAAEEAAKQEVVNG